MRSALLLLVLIGCRLRPEAARSALASIDPNEREKAASTLRATYAEAPEAVGDHGAPHWNARLENARGKKTSEAFTILGSPKHTGGEAGGGGESIAVRLDDFWMATIGRSTRGDDIVFATGEAWRAVEHVDVEPPRSFTGTWSTYYVHGALYETVALRAGVRESVKQFRETGQLKVETTLRDGALERQRRFRESGTLESCDLFRAGVPEPCP